MFEELYIFERSFCHVVTKWHWKGSLFAAHGIHTMVSIQNENEDG